MRAGQTVLITQNPNSIHVGFQFFDPATQLAETTECRFNHPAATCVLRANAFTFGTTAITTYAWRVQYTYGGEIKVLTQTGQDPEFRFTDTCGLLGSSADGAPQPLFVTLTVTDSIGETATAISGTYDQPPLQLRLYNCP